VDYQAKTVEIFTLEAGRYTLSGQYAESERAVSKELEGFEVAVGALFD